MTQRGSITIEVIIAFGLFVFGMGSIVVLISGSDQLVMDTEKAGYALRSATNRLALLHGTAQKKFSSLASESRNDTIYQEESVVLYKGPFISNITVSEKWNSSPLRSEHTTISTLVSDHHSLLGTQSCPALAPDNTHLTLSGSVDLGASYHGTDIKIAGTYAYLTAYSTGSGTTARPDFFVIDISNPSTPVIRASLNTGPGLAALRIAGTYAYVANTSRTAQLQVIDIQDPTHPKLISSYKLPGVSGAGLQGTGNSIAYANERIYIGTTKAIGPELHIVDVSHPQTPRGIGSWESNTLIHSITMYGTRIYISTPTSDQLRALDISDPARISTLATFQPADASTNNGQVAHLAGSLLYFGRNMSATSSAAAQQLFFLDTSREDSFSSLNSLRISASINDMVGHTGYLLLATNDATKDLQLWNVSHTATPVHLSTLDLSSSPIALACDADHIYAALDDAIHTFQIIDLKP